MKFCVRFERDTKETVEGPQHGRECSRAQLLLVTPAELLPAQEPQGLGNYKAEVQAPLRYTLAVSPWVTDFIPLGFILFVYTVHTTQEVTGLRRKPCDVCEYPL